MGSQLTGPVAPLPAAAGHAVVPGASTPSAPADPGTGADTARISALQGIVAIVQQLILAVAAQQATAGAQVNGGGALAAPAPAPVSAALNTGVIGGGHFSASAPFTASPTSLVGGGGGSITASTGATGTSVVGGGGSAGTSSTSVATGLSPFVGGGGVTTPASGAFAGPAAAAGTQGAAPAVTGGGGASTAIDMNRVAGTPQPGGVVDTIIRSASTTAGAALSEGSYIEVADAGGARMQVHVHGAWQHHPQHILEGIRQGFLQPHLHPDGTVHLHDVRA